VRAKCSFYDELETVVRWAIDLLNSRSLSRKVGADRLL